MFYALAGDTTLFCAPAGVANVFYVPEDDANLLYVPGAANFVSHVSACYAISCYAPTGVGSLLDEPAGRYEFGFRTSR